jgi:hypothetical protein
VLPVATKMATTLDAVVKLNSHRKTARSARVRSVEKELLQLLRSAPKHFQSKTPLSAKQLLNRCDHLQCNFAYFSLSRIYHHLSPASKTSLDRLRQVLLEFGQKYTVGFGVRSDKDEVWLDWFTETGVEVAYVAEGYGLPWIL